MRKTSAGVLVAVLVLVTAAYAQFGGFRNSSNYPQNDPPETEFVFARWRYNTGNWSRGDGWAHDYPNAEEHILQVMSELTRVDVERMSYRWLDLSSPEIFQYPFSYISEPGEMQLTELEVEHLRQYIDRGGFIMVDDFGGQGNDAFELQVFQTNLRRAFPDRELFELSESHPIFHMYYAIDGLQTEHPMTRVRSVFFGFPDDLGGLSMIVCYRNDVGDYWEFLNNPRYQLQPSAEAVKLGLNFVYYAMTH